MNENLNFKNEVKPLYSKLVPSDLNAGNTSREFYQYKDDSSKVIRIDSMDDLVERYDNLADPKVVIELGKKLFQEIQTNYNIQVPSEIIVDKNEENKDTVYIITDKIDGVSLEKAEETPEFLKKLEDLYVSISKYYLDKLNSGEAHLADLNGASQYIYGTKKGNENPEIYLVDTDLYLNKGDAFLLHNVKWLIRHMLKRFDEAIKNIRKIIETPLSKDLSEKEKVMAEKEIQESLSLLNGTFKNDDTKDEEGFIPSHLDSDKIEKFKNIENISFEEVSSDTSDSIEIKAYKDDSQEIVLKKLKEKLIQENWWLQDEFKNEGFPKEQFIINGNQNEYSIYNFNENLSEEQKNSIIKGISFLEKSTEISSLKEITILIRKTERTNSNSQQPFYGNNYSESKVINIYPRALKNEGYREIPEISGLEATIIHEFSHPIYDKMEQKLKEEWSNFGWETTTEEERKNENMYAIKPKESNKCITKYAQFAEDEDFCESVVGLYAQSSKLDSEKKTFLENNIFNKLENIPLAEITKKEKVELPKLPENIKFHKKEVSKISIIKK